MSHQTNRSLPEELVVKIFTMKGEKGEELLDLKDRVRGMAVCKSWHSYLHPCRWPIHECSLERGSVKLADWVVQVEPAVRKLTISLEDVDAPTLESPRFRACYNALLSLHPRAALKKLKLFGNSEPVQGFLPALASFPNLTYLHLAGTADEESFLKSQHFGSLSVLAKLVLRTWVAVRLEGSATLLPNLQHLVVHETAELELDVPLPQLHTLEVEHVGFVRLVGQHLHLPALQLLSLFGHYGEMEADLDLQRLTALQDLGLRGTLRLHGMAPLPLLTVLTLMCESPGEQGEVEQLLRLASQSLQDLHLKVLHWDEDEDDLRLSPLEPGLEAALAACTQLTELTLRASDPDLAQLGAMSRLQVLRLNNSLHDLTIAEVMQLGQLRQLQCLALAADHMQAGQEATVQGAIELLKHALPTGCIVELD